MPNEARHLRSINDLLLLPLPSDSHERKCAKQLDTQCRYHLSFVFVLTFNMPNSLLLRQLF
jgi:hypothetical protein